MEEYMKIKKSTLIPFEWKEQIKLLDPGRLRVEDYDMKEKGNYLDVFRIQNKLDEPITIINEYGETTTIVGDNNSKIEKLVYLSFNRPKVQSESNNGKLLHIDIKESVLKEHRAIYFPAINLVLTTTAMYQYYDIRHPYDIRNYDRVVEAAVKQLMDTIAPLSFMWWINEPIKSNKTFYMSLGDEIVIIPKTHFINKEMTFDLVKPKGSLINAGVYETISHSLKEFQDDQVKELKFNIGKFEFSVYLSVSERLLRTELDKQSKNIKNLIPKSELDTIINIMENNHKNNIKELHDDHGKKLETLLSDLQEKIKIIEKERDNFKYQLEVALNTSKMYSQFHKDESATEQARAKTESARHSVTKERMSIWSDAVKYGLGGLITLVTILIAQKNVK